MPGIDANNSRQPFEQIADHFRAEINAGRLKPGDQLPSVRDIAATFNVALGTVNSAMKVLKDDGAIVSWQGKGAFVRDPVVATSSSDTADPVALLGAVMARLDELEAAFHAVAGRVEQLEGARQKKGR